MPDLKRGRESLGPESISFFLTAGIVLSIICVIVLTRKYRYVKGFFENGTSLKGIVTDQKQFRDRGRIFFEYLHKESIYTYSAAVHFSRKVKSLEKGAVVTILIKNNDPKKPLLKDLYL